MIGARILIGLANRLRFVCAVAAAMHFRAVTHGCADQCGLNLKIVGSDAEGVSEAVCPKPFFLGCILRLEFLPVREKPQRSSEAFATDGWRPLQFIPLLH